jgi:hypothetical protein
MGETIPEDGAIRRCWYGFEGAFQHVFSATLVRFLVHKEGID